jgi:RNA polymerase sigma-70 factor (ECF subfamily)
MSHPPDLSAATDMEVVAWARQGREEGYRELLHRYQRRVYALIRRVIGDREEARDLTQEAFVKAFRALERHPPERKVSAWIFRIANHTAIDYLRRKELTPLPLDDPPDVTPSGTVRPTALGLATLSEPSAPGSDARRTAAALEQAIKRVRGKYRRCLVLRLLEERSYDDIAETLGLPLGTVKSHLHRGRKELRKMLADLPDASGSDPASMPA